MTCTEAPIVIASVFAPTYPGGLAGYQRQLAAVVARRTQSPGVFLYRDIGHPELPATAEGDLAWPMLALQPTLLGQLTRWLWPKLASRSATFPLLKWIIIHSWKMPPDLHPRAIHFVGTGWDLIGFFLKDFADKAGITFTVFPAVHPGQWGDDHIDIELFREADSVFCLSEHERIHLNEKGVPRDRLDRCYLFPMCQSKGDAVKFRLAHELGDRPCVLFIGRRDQGKGYIALLDAWKIVTAQAPDAVLLLAGPHWLKDESARIAQLPPASVRNLGMPDTKTISDALAACDIFCLPSSAESFGIVFLEAWSFHKPVICGTAPATRELVENNVTGLWSDQNPDTLATALLHLLDDPNERRRLGDAGYQFQQAYYTEEHFLDAFREALKLPTS